MNSRLLTSGGAQWTRAAVRSCKPNGTESASISSVLDAAYFSLIADYTADLISVHGADGEYLYVSGSSGQLFGWTPEQLLGYSVQDFVHVDDRQEIEACAALLAQGRDGQATYRMLCPSNRYRWVETRSRPSADGRHFVSVTRDVHEKVRLFRRLRRQAYSDPLTGLHNRRSLGLLLSSELQRSRRKCLTLAVAFIDCDRFKIANDRYGHDRGDEILRSVSRCIAQARRTYDVAGRWGGDEFLLLLPETTACEAMLVGNRVRQLLTQDLPDMTVSVGVSSTEHADSAEELLTQSDTALYEAKRLGGNRVAQWRYR